MGESIGSIDRNHANHGLGAEVFRQGLGTEHFGESIEREWPSPRLAGAAIEHVAQHCDGTGQDVVTVTPRYNPTSSGLFHL
jgi:hypothetical protein